MYIIVKKYKIVKMYKIVKKRKENKNTGKEKETIKGTGLFRKELNRISRNKQYNHSS